MTCQTPDEWKAFFLTPEGQRDTEDFMQQKITVAKLKAYQKTPEGIGRYAAIKELYDNRPRPDALDRAQELMRLPMGQVPPGAIAYVKHLSEQGGLCGAVIATAYELFAQYAEGLPNPNGPDEDAERFFAARGELKRTSTPPGPGG